MKTEYNSLLQLRTMAGWPILQALWAIQHTKIVEATRKAGKRNRGDIWKYYAGQLEGFEIAITQLERALQEMEKEAAEVEPSSEAKEQVEALIKKLKGDQPE
jgi:hypothetical protein